MQRKMTTLRFLASAFICVYFVAVAFNIPSTVESKVVPAYYGINCNTDTSEEEYFCNKLLGWCNLLVEWEDNQIMENQECCYDVLGGQQDSPPINEYLQKRVHTCMTTCVGLYKYFQCNGRYVDLIKEKWIESDGKGNLTVVDFPNNEDFSGETKKE